MRQSNDTRKPVFKFGLERDTTTFDDFKRNINPSRSSGTAL